MQRTHRWCRPRSCQSCASGQNNTKEKIHFWCGEEKTFSWQMIQKKIMILRTICNCLEKTEQIPVETDWQAECGGNTAKLINLLHKSMAYQVIITPYKCREEKRNIRAFRSIDQHPFGRVGLVEYQTSRNKWLMTCCMHWADFSKPRSSSFPLP